MPRSNLDLTLRDDRAGRTGWRLNSAGRMPRPIPRATARSTAVARICSVATRCCRGSPRIATSLRRSASDVRSAATPPTMVCERRTEGTLRSALQPARGGKDLEVRISISRRSCPGFAPLISTSHRRYRHVNSTERICEYLYGSIRCCCAGTEVAGHIVNDASSTESSRGHELKPAAREAGRSGHRQRGRGRRAAAAASPPAPISEAASDQRHPTEQLDTTRTPRRLLTSPRT
jgi:hypothetical protein